MLQRIKRAYKVLRGEERPLYAVKRSAMTREEAAKLAKETGGVVAWVNDPSDIVRVDKEEEVGDGKGEFLPDFTEQEFNDYIRDEEQGWGVWRKKLKL